MRKSIAVPYLLTIFLLALGITACQHAPGTSLEENKNEVASGDNKILFTAITPAESGIDFQNELIETESWNYYKYMYSYIGGGVAAADFNNDGWVDLFFVSNTKDNKLYLNKGNFTFEDITTSAGIEKRPGFDAGVAVVDVNNDGWLDIYISRGGWSQENNAFANMLYLNNGNSGVPSFTEQAESFGLADANRAIQSTFFDYDKDGDLDLYISNTPDFEDKAETVLDLTAVQKDPRTIAMKGFDRLYRNEGQDKFTDVSEAAGIMPDIGFGLNPQVGDLNNDGWLDIYVCNDFRIPDFAYLNNGDGTFREGRNEIVKHMSFNSMGSDFGDVNNDGLPDLFALDMNPEDYRRSKTTMAMTSLSLFEDMVRKDYHHQYMHNMLQINNGNGTYREIANLAGVANTDWSWSCLLADFDLDGYQDIYVTNGVFRDVIDRDKNKEILELLRKNQRKPTDKDFLTFAQMLPQQKLTNYLFRNKGDLTFEDVSQEWANPHPTFSNGATYADLDNDGDLDLVVNNLNEAATLLRNNTIDQSPKNYLKVQLKGPNDNPFGVGAAVKIVNSKEDIQVRQLISSRGFLSAVPHILHFGLGDYSQIASLEIQWADGKIQRLNNLPVNQLLVLDYTNALVSGSNDKSTVQSTLFEPVNFDFSHSDPAFNDYEKQILLPHKLSQTGPAVAKGDVNGDGLEDVYLGGGHTQAGQLLLANRKGGFQARAMADFQKDRQKEDVSACFFDADNDGDLDLYVVSGSYEFSLRSKLMLDRLYLNDGKGNFSKTADRLPMFAAAGSVVSPADIDQDGDIDLFVGSRVLPGQYPFPPLSYLLINEQGRFSVQTAQLAPELEQLGMITDAVWADIDQDQDPDLIVTGEWMGIEVFINKNGALERSEDYEQLQSNKGAWNRVVVADIDQDGDQDIIAGNLGLNYKIHASAEKPFHVYANDFDYNGSVDIMLAKNYKDSEVPVRGRTCTAQQMPHVAEKIPTFNEFANSDLEEIVGPGIKSALHYEIKEFRSGLFINQGDKHFEFTPFPNSIQEAPVNGIIYTDVTGDQEPDLLLAGNNYMAEVETTRWDAGIGRLLIGDGKGSFTEILPQKSGFFADGDVRNLVLLNSSNSPMILVVNNNAQQELYKVVPNPDL